VNIRLRTINTWLQRVGLVLVVNIDDDRPTGATEFELTTWHAFTEGRPSRIVAPEPEEGRG
jgi:hypothetical protein